GSSGPSTPRCSWGRSSSTQTGWSLGNSLSFVCRAAVEESFLMTDKVPACLECRASKAHIVRRIEDVCPDGSGSLGLGCRQDSDCLVRREGLDEKLSGLVC
ncbi:hypothetical protein XENORESO_015592, partial [Xenotaenia resolanae]